MECSCFDFFFEVIVRKFPGQLNPEKLHRFHEVVVVSLMEKVDFLHAYVCPRAGEDKVIYVESPRVPTAELQIQKTQSKHK